MPKRKSITTKTKTNAKRKTAEDTEIIYQRRSDSNIDDVPRQDDDAPRQVGDASIPNTSGTALNIQTVGYLPAPVQNIKNSVGEHVSAGVRDKIQNGDYVDLSVLLDTTQKTQNNSSKLLIINGELVSQPSPKAKINDIKQWTDAFIIYMSIFLARHHEKTQEMLKYMQIIRLGAARSNLGWRKYDEQFRLRKTNDPASSWGEVDSELWLLYIHQNNIPQIQSNTPKPNNYALGKCFDYNYKGFCSRAFCSYLHCCIKCNKEHPAATCPNNNPALGTPMPTPRFNRPSTRGNVQPFLVKGQFSPRFNQSAQPPRPRYPQPALGPRKFTY